MNRGWHENGSEREAGLADHELTVRGARFWIGDPVPAPSARLRAAGAESGPEDLVAAFGRVGRDGKRASGDGTVRYDPVRRRAIVEFEERTGTLEAADVRDALEKFLATHLLAGRIILIP